MPQLEKYIHLVKELREIVNQPQPRTVLDIELERRFFQEFLPDAIHPDTGFPVQLYEYQRKALSNAFTHQRNLWEWGRQTGKTSTSGLFLSFMSREMKGDVIISAQNHQRAKEIVFWTRRWCLAHRQQEYANNIDQDAATHLYFKSGMRIIALAHDQSSRGFSPRIRILDECELIVDSDLPALLPTGLVTTPKDVLMGTVYGTGGWWWRFLNQHEQLHYNLEFVRSSDAVLPTGPISGNELANLRSTLGDAFFEQECELIPIPDIDTFFGMDLVKASFGGY